MNMRLRSYGLAGAAVVSVGVALGAGIAMVVPTGAAPVAESASVVQAASPGAKQHQALLSGCQGTGAPLGVAGRLAPGKTVADLNAQGLRAKALGDLVLIDPVTSSGSMTSASQLTSQRALTSSGEILPQSSRADLHSCDYHLADRLAAQRYITAAQRALVAQGLASHTNVTDAASMDPISDDPVVAGRLLVTIKFPGHAVANAPSGAPQLVTMATGVVLLDGSSAEALGATTAG